MFQWQTLDWVLTRHDLGLGIRNLNVYGGCSYSRGAPINCVNVLS